MRVRDINGRGVRWVGERTHGIRSTYVAGCRCDPCRDAEAEYSRQRYWEKRRVVHCSSTGKSPEVNPLSTRSAHPERR